MSIVMLVLVGSIESVPSGLAFDDVARVDRTFLARLERLADERPDARRGIVGVEWHLAAGEHPHASRRRPR